MFTKSGDDGNTKIGKDRIGKDSPLVNMIGDLDELNSFLGLLWAKVEWEDLKKDIDRIQYSLFKIGEELSQGKTDFAKEELRWIEERAVEYRKESGPVRLFVVPGGCEIASQIHIARAVCRRVERNAVKYSKEIGMEQRWHIVYLNRLSSLLFSMAVLANKRKGITERIYDINKFY